MTRTERGRERRREKIERRKAWLAGDPPDVGQVKDPPSSRALVTRPSAAPLVRQEAIPSRELMIASEYARGGSLVDVTAEVCGDPAPGRSALNFRHSDDADPRRRRIAPMPPRELRSPDEVFVERWMMDHPP